MDRADAPHRPLVRKRRRGRMRGFFLTPLVDVIFLLLIFFMVSSDLGRVAMLPLRVAAAGPAGVTAETGDAPVAVFTGPGGFFQVDRQAVARGDLAARLTAAAAEGRRSLLLTALKGSTVQDLVDVYDAAGAAGIARIAVRGAP